MNTVEGDIVLTQDRSSSVVHKRVRVGKSLATFEGCNQDGAGAYRILFDLVEADTPYRTCRRCFPDPVVPDNEGVPI